MSGEVDHYSDLAAVSEKSSHWFAGFFHLKKQAMYRRLLRYDGVETDEIVTENITQQSLNILKRLDKTANVSTVMHAMPEVMEMMKWGLSA